MSQTNHPWDAPVTAGSPPAPKLAPKTPSVLPPKICLEHTAFSTPIESQIDGLREKMAALCADMIELRIGLARMFIETDTGLDGVHKQSKLGQEIIALADRMGLALYE